MSLLVTGIRLPFDEPETAALDRARRLTGLLSSETEAAVCRVDADAARSPAYIRCVWTHPATRRHLRKSCRCRLCVIKKMQGLPFRTAKSALRTVRSSWVSALPDCSRRTRSPGTASVRSYSSAAAIWTSATGR